MVLMLSGCYENAHWRGRGEWYELRGRLQMEKAGFFPGWGLGSGSLHFWVARKAANASNRRSVSDLNRRSMIGSKIHRSQRGLAAKRNL
jgi:hypothetical protein